MRIKIPWFLALMPAVFITVFAQPTPQDAAAHEWKRRLREIVNETDWSESVEELAASMPEDQTIETLDQLVKENAAAPGAMLLGALLLRRWTAEAPADAAKWVARLPDSRFGQAACREVAPLLAERDLAEAVAWAHRLPPGENKTAALLSLGYEAATRKEAETAVALATLVPPGPERDSLLNYSIRQWATTDRESAVNWVKRSPDATLREEMLGQIAIDWGIQNPVETAEFVSIALADGKDRDNAVINIVRFWAPSAPAQTAAWVEQLPEGPLRDAAMENLIDVWAKDDISSAGAWIGQLRPDRSRDAALSVYASLLAASDLDEAANWAEAIQNDALRAKAKAYLNNR